jgi:hypothetical protein
MLGQGDAIQGAKPKGPMIPHVTPQDQRAGEYAARREFTLGPYLLDK